MSDLKSMLGYSKGSPFFNNPYLDINSPSGAIDMSNTPIDLYGIDEYGNKQKMKANRKKPYQFTGKIITEIPTKRQAGGNLTPKQFQPAYMQYSDSLDAGVHPTMLKTGPNSFFNLSQADQAKLEKQYKDRVSQSNSFFTQFGSALMNAVQHPGDLMYGLRTAGSAHYIPKEQQGGYTMDDLHDFLFEDDQEQGQQEDYPTPSIEETNENIQSQYNQLQDDQDESLALQIAMGDDDQTDWGGNPYMGGGRGAGNNSGFRSFSSYQEGRKALENQLELYKTGKTKNKVGPRSTLLEAMSVYAPSSDNNNPTAYANFIANKIGVSPNTPISRLDTRKWADAIEIMEGNKKGNNPGNLR